MSLMTQIKDLQIAARKQGNSAASLYTTLLGEAGMIGKNAGNRETTDAEVVAVVKKFIKNVDETIVALTQRNQDTSVFTAERQLLEQFLPQQLTQQTLENLARQCSSMPEFMKHLKQNYAGQYDGALAQQVAKTVYSK